MGALGRSFWRSSILRLLCSLMFNCMVPGKGRFGSLRTAKEHALSSAQSIIARFHGKSTDTQRLFLGLAVHFSLPTLTRACDLSSFPLRSSRPLNAYGTCHPSTLPQKTPGGKCENGQIYGLTPYPLIPLRANRQGGSWKKHFG
jgi:hypothetical protein